MKALLASLLIFISAYTVSATDLRIQYDEPMVGANYPANYECVASGQAKNYTTGIIYALSCCSGNQTGSCPAKTDTLNRLIMVSHNPDGTTKGSGTTMIPEQYGARGDGVTDDTSAFLQYAAAVSASTVSVRAAFTPGAVYLLSATIPFDLPPDSVVDARGANFIFTHNGTGFDLNPSFTAIMPVNSDTDVYTKRNIHWLGGHFTSTNATNTANNAIQAFFMRNVTFQDVRIEGNFYAGFKFGGKDTYEFRNCYTGGAVVRHYWVPPEGTLYGASYTGNALIDVEWRGDNMSLASPNQAGVYIEDTIINARFAGGNINGPSTVAHVYIKDGSVIPSYAISFSGTHFEQMAYGIPAVYFSDAGGAGFNGISFDEGAYFYSSNYRWAGVMLNNCHHVKFGTCVFFNGASTSGQDVPAWGVYVSDSSGEIIFDRSCEFNIFLNTNGAYVGGTSSHGGLIQIETTLPHPLLTGDRIFMANVTGTIEANGMWIVTKIDGTHFDLQGSTYTNAWISGGNYKPLNAVALQSTSGRKNITVLPEIVNLTTPLELSSYSLSSQSTYSGWLINMGQQLSQFIATGSPPVVFTYLWPKGYDLHVSANDSGAAGASCYVQLYNPDNTSSYGMVRLRITPFDSILWSTSGYVSADASGNLKLDVSASGSGTMQLGIAVSAIRQ